MSTFHGIPTQPIIYADKSVADALAALASAGDADDTYSYCRHFSMDRLAEGLGIRLASGDYMYVTDAGALCVIEMSDPTGVPADEYAVIGRR